MANYLNLLLNPQLKHEKIFEVMRDFRKGGLNPDNFQEFITAVKQPLKNGLLQESATQILLKLGLKDISENELNIIRREVIRRGSEKNKKCWHPEASEVNCNLNENGNIAISGAHSIQNNGVLSQIAEKGHVTSIGFETNDFQGDRIGKNNASVFWGFCNTHDKVFEPIEKHRYSGSIEQNFLFAYRAFVVSAHRKNEVSSFVDFGVDAENDIALDKEKFDHAITNKRFTDIITYPIILPKYYPIAVSSSFYLDFDFAGNRIHHKKERMEFLFVTLLPDKVNNKTYLLLSYFKEDQDIYKNLGEQLELRNNLLSDITMILAAHAENVFFNPIYYNTFIKRHEQDLKKLVFETQMDIATLDSNGKIANQMSMTPNQYLNNHYGINYFGYGL